jgi:hypothetical protein
MADVRRSLLIWLLAVLLPLQGWAAAAGLPCGPGQHAPSSQLGLHAEQATDGHASPRAWRSSPGHLAGHDHHEPDAASAAADSVAPAGAEPAPHDTTHTCSACAACCPGLAPPGALVTVARLPAAGPVLAVPGAGAASAVVGGLERPPRAIVG